MINGIDISSYQPKPRFAEVKIGHPEAGPCDFVIVKVTEGNRYENPHAREQVKSTIDEGMLPILYHFASPNGPNWLNDAQEESRRLDSIADKFENELGRRIFCFLDVERNVPLSKEEAKFWREWCNEFRDFSVKVGGRPVGMYGGRFFLNDLHLDDTWIKTLLWQAGYPIPWRPKADYLPAVWPGGWPKAALPWPRPDIVQDGGGMAVAAGGNSATWPGIDGYSDVNRFAGTREELEALIEVAA